MLKKKHLAFFDMAFQVNKAIYRYITKEET